jgi:subtilisin family serine protease
MFLARNIIDSNQTFLPDIVNDITKGVETVKKFLFIIGFLGGMLVFQVPVHASDTPTTQAAKMLTKVQADGQINVIVNIDVTIPAHISSLTGVEHDQALMAVITDAQDLLLQRLNDAGVAVSNIIKFPYTPQISMTVTEEAFLALRSDSSVDQIIENGSLDGKLGQSVPNIFPSVATSNFSGSGYTVAVLDTGVDTNHIAFEGKVVAEACFSGAGDDILSFCPNGEPVQIGPGAGINFDCDLVITDSTQCDHGTHVAGIAVGGNMPGPAPNFGLIHGVAKQANLIPIQVFSKILRSDGTVGSTALFTDIAMALSHVYMLRNDSSVGKIAVVNMSLGGNGPINTMEECDNTFGSMALRPIIKMLKEANIATVVSSGNSNFETGIAVPACIEEAIAVGATDNNDNKYNFCASPDDHDNCGSSSGDLLDLWAPGVNIYSANAESDFGFGVTTASGTSSAAPHVAGAWAVMKQSKPTATVDEIENAFKSTGKPITIAGVTRKRIDIDEALEVLSDSGTPTSPGIVDACQQGLFANGSLKAGEAVCIPDFSNGGQFQSEIYVPNNKVGSTMEIILSHGSGNGNLLHRHDNRPTRTVFDHISENSGNEERILVENVQERWNYIHVRADNEFSDVTILVRYIESSTPPLAPSPTTPDIQIVDACQEGQTPVGNVQLFAGTAVCVQDFSNRGQAQMHLYVTEDKVGSTLEILLSHGFGNSELLHKHNRRPSRTVFDHVSNNPGNEERILVENVQLGWNYIHVQADTAFAGVTLLPRYIQE